MSSGSLHIEHLALRSAEDVHEIFRLLGYDTYDPQPYEGDDLADLELDEVDEANVERAYVISDIDNHQIWLYEVSDLRQTRLRGLAWNMLQRGTGLLVVTRDYKEIIFVDPRLVGNPTKSNVRVNKLKLVVGDATRHDLDTLNAIHAFDRSGQDIYNAQAEAFNVERITNRFYNEYRDHFVQVQEAVQEYNKGIQDFYDEEKLHAFTQRLMGRLMFLYFLQRKGWLGGKPRFLTDQYRRTAHIHSDEYQGDEETFFYYREVLEPLFFDTMNTQRPDNITIWEGVRIPYLNGGLFDQSRDPEGTIILPDGLFDIHTGLLAFFNRYNFTIADDTPLEQDVAVDPEMLGKVFENMLEEQDRGQTGSFYTPRSIVSYMCQESLAGYLDESADILRDLTRAQFDPDDEQTFTPDQAEAAMAVLDTLTVLDPAVGSGSFLIGMLAEIIRLRRACSTALDKEITPAILAAWKEAIIRDTLYGVDIKPEAIEVAQLRLWLALVVNQTMADARPLPNLDYKLMAGDSLIETIDGEPVLDTSVRERDSDDKSIESPTQSNFMGDPVQGKMALFSDEKAVKKEQGKLDEMRRKFFDAPPQERSDLRKTISNQEREIVFASLNSRAENLQEKIDELGKKSGRLASAGGELTQRDKKKLGEYGNKLARITGLQTDLNNPEKSLPFFLYRLHFSEVFESKGGFDVVVANPPYVSVFDMDKENEGFKARLKKNYSTAKKGFDLYVPFMERGIQLANHGGHLAYITPNKLLSAEYAIAIRQYFDANTQLILLADLSGVNLFDAAVYPVITLAKKKPNNKGSSIEIYKSEGKSKEDVRVVFSHNVNSSLINATSKHLWSVVSHPLVQMLQPIIESPFKVSDVATVLASATVSEAYEWKEAVVDNGKELHTQNPDRYRRFIVTGNIRPFYETWNSSNVQYLKQTYSKPVIDTLHPNIKEKRITQIKATKVIVSGMSKVPTALYDEEGISAGIPVIFLHPKAQNGLYLSALINSSMMRIIYNSLYGALSLSGKYLRFGKPQIIDLPIPNISNDFQEEIAGLTRQIIQLVTIDDTQSSILKRQVDQLVYQAYGLDSKDIVVIEKHLGKS